MSFTYPQLERLVTREFEMQLKLAADSDHGLHVPCLLGPPGLGKTAMIRAYAQKEELPLISINAGEAGDVTEVTGLLLPSKTEMRANIPVLRMGLQEGIARACTEPVVLFFDDVDKSSDQIQGALLSILGNRRVRSYALHSQTVVAAAGNRPEDDVLARELSESLRTRMTAMELTADLKSWTAWGLKTSSVHPAIAGFLQYAPKSFYGKTADSSRFPTPRGWVEASTDLFSAEPSEDLIGKPDMPAWHLFVSLRCGAPTGSAFWAWYRHVQSIDLKTLLSTGKIKSAIAGADNPLLKHSACFAVAAWLEKHKAGASAVGLPVFVEELEPEYQVAFYIQLAPAAARNLDQNYPQVLAMCAKAMEAHDH